MEPLTWTGVLGGFLDPVLFALAGVFIVAVLVQISLSVVASGDRVVTNPDGTLSSSTGLYGTVSYTHLTLPTKA